MSRQYKYAVTYKDLLESVKSAMYTGEIEYVVALNNKEAIRKVKEQLGDKLKQCRGFDATRTSKQYEVKSGKF